MKTLLLAKLAYLYYYAARIIIRFYSWVPGFYRHHSLNSFEPKVGIEAGPQGWQSIELKELYQSACEYFGNQSVARFVIDRTAPYPPQLEKFISDNRITHFLYDPRAGRSESEQNYFKAWKDSFAVLIILSRYQVVPIGYLTDISVRLWRCQVSVVTSLRGVVVTFMHPRPARPMFPHRRILGPSLMPFSLQTLQYLETQKASLTHAQQIENVVRFTGSLYEPRTTFLNQFKEIMGDLADIRGRALGSKRQTDETYWMWICSASIIITTAEQIHQPGADLRHIPQLVYRCLEVLAADTLLLAPIVPGIERYFVPEKEFAAFSNLEEACSKARYYLEHPSEARVIASAGHAKAKVLIACHVFWLQIDSVLGEDGFLIRRCIFAG